ncbi:MAG TPA: dihydrofolate reductase family protein [Acidimicrobiia bacterium]|jgi:5-amino-6-(5-phosphoribosylamino)uracil reductase|nr:dihydrofolate reductase family protein [Acidimicrobiia bacterium]
MLRRTESGEPVEDLVGLYMNDERKAEGRPWVLINFISSADGGTAIEGKSSSLGDPDDKAVFQALRAVPDVILVGSGTVEAEDYQPVTLDEERRERRLAAGLTEVPVLAIVSGRLSFNTEARVFSDPEHRPMVITGPRADPVKLAMLGDAADVVILEEVTPAAILARLSAAKIILCEGGPTLVGQFVAGHMIDELALTIAPLLIGGRSARIAHGETADPPVEMRLDRQLIGDRSLFMRYLKN